MNVEYKYPLWDAFCTMYWFATGDKIISKSNHPAAHKLYRFWMMLDN